MPREGSDRHPLTLVVAMSANVLVATAKFGAALFTGSAAMFAEGVHSLVDTLNQGILMIGARRSERSPDPTHPFGYGKEVYFWALIYSVLLMGVGGGVSVYKGVEALRHPEPIDSFFWSYVILGVAVAAESVSWLTAWRALRKNDAAKRRRARPVWRQMGEATDPSHFAILAEDGAAVIGASVAFSGLALSQYTGSSVPDGVASIAIGCVLCGAAIGVTLRTRSLLVGQAVSEDILEELRRLIRDEPGVVFAGTPLTMHLGPREVLAAINVQFDPELPAPQVARSIDHLEAAIRERFPEFTRIYVEAQLVRRDIQREQVLSPVEPAAALPAAGSSS